MKLDVIGCIGGCVENIELDDHGCSAAASFMSSSEEVCIWPSHALFSICVRARPWWACWKQENLLKPCRCRGCYWCGIRVSTVWSSVPRKAMERVGIAAGLLVQVKEYLSACLLVRRASAVVSSPSWGQITSIMQKVLGNGAAAGRSVFHHASRSPNR